VPRLFADNPARAKEGFESNTDLAFRDLTKVLGRFFTAENLAADKSMAYIASPK
jgi:hypothetical protein